MNDLVKGFLWTAGAVTAIVLADMTRRRLLGSAAVPVAPVATVVDDELNYLETAGVELDSAAVSLETPDWWRRVLGIYPLPTPDIVTITGPQSQGSIESMDDLIARYQRFSFGINPPRSRLIGITTRSSGGYAAPTGGATVTGGSSGSGGTSGWTFS